MVFTKTVINFDIVVDFDAKNKALMRDELAKEVSSLYPGYKVNITIDYDYSD